MAATRYIQAAVSQAEYTEIKKAALDAGMTLQVFLRDTIMERVNKHSKEKELHRGQD